MNHLFSLGGKRILVTGGTRGIGRAISLRFAQAGAFVIANFVRDIESAEKLKQEAQDQGFKLEICRADVTGNKGIERLIDHIGSGENTLSGLVHCAATGVHKPIVELTPRHFDFIFSLNVRAFFELVRVLLPNFSKGSSIIAVSSKGAVRAVPSYSLIGSSKGALESLARNLAAELATKGIRINIISPGSVATDAWNVMPNREERLGETIRRTPIGRLTTPDDVAWAAQFLCSDASSAIVGHTLVVDGGAGIVE